MRVSGLFARVPTSSRTVWVHALHVCRAETHADLRPARAGGATVPKVTALAAHTVPSPAWDGATVRLRETGDLNQGRALPSRGVRQTQNFPEQFSCKTFLGRDPEQRSPSLDTPLR